MYLKYSGNVVWKRQRSTGSSPGLWSRPQLRNGRVSVPPTGPATASGCCMTARLTKSLSTWPTVWPLGGRKVTSGLVVPSAYPWLSDPPRG